MDGLKRHTAEFPCGACAGHVGLPEGHGIRCAGFTLDHVIYCTREEHAGRLPFDTRVSPGAYKHRRFGACDCGTAHGWAIAGTGTLGAIARPPIASIEERDEMYGFALSLLDVRPNALQDLRRRGLSDEAIAAWRFRSIPKSGKEQKDFMRAMADRFGQDLLRRCPGFVDKNKRLTFWIADAKRDGYIIPYVDERGRITGLQQKRFDGGYRSPSGAQLDKVYCIAGAAEPGCDLHVTEGGTKAIVSSELSGRAVFAVAGQSLQATHIEVIKRLAPARVIVCLDREPNVNTDHARKRWLDMLAATEIPTFDGVWEGTDVGGPKGLDDLCLAGGRPRLRQWTILPSSISGRRTPRAIPVAGAIASGTTIDDARRTTSRAIVEFISDSEAHRGEALLVEAAPGTGKTTATARALDSGGARGRILVGTTRLAAELSAEFGYTHVEGRSEENCERIEVVDALATNGHDVEELACGSEKKPRCPARDRCAYYRQFDSIGTRIAASEQLYNPRFLQGGNVAIADDAELLRSTIEHRLLTVDSLQRAVKALAKRRRPAARTVLGLIGIALLDVEMDETPSPLLGASVWDELVKSARRRGVDFCASVDALPKNGTLPPPGASEAAILSVGDVEVAVPGTMQALLDVLRDELPMFRAGDDFNSCLKIDKDGLHVSRLREPAVDRRQRLILRELPLLVLEATPIPALVDRLTEHHVRLPDVKVDVALPENVTVVQHASSSNGRTVLKERNRAADVLCEVSAERERFPVGSPEREAAICFRFMRNEVEGLGIAPNQVLTFGSVRGLNALADVERLQVIGRPMAPTNDLLYLAQVIHHGESAISRQVVVEPRRYGGQRFEVDVVDFEDERAAALLKATRDDELVQVIHRARLYTLEPQQDLFRRGREAVRLVLHTGHPIPGLRVDELHVTALRRDVNAERADDAEARVRAAVETLKSQGKPIGVNAVATMAKSDKRTVGKALGTPVDTLIDLFNKGVHHVPRTSSIGTEVAASEGRLCAGGCGKALPHGHAKCSDCAAAAVSAWRGEATRRRSTA